MLFFFELFLFVLVMVTLALGEFVSRWLALIVWTSATVLVLLGYLLARRSLQAALHRDGADVQPDPLSGELAHGHDHAPAAGEPPVPAEQAPPEPAPPAIAALDERWARVLLYNWRRANVLLVLGVCAVAAWYWLAG